MYICINPKSSAYPMTAPPNVPRANWTAVIMD